MRRLLDLGGLPLEMPPFFEQALGYPKTPGRRYLAFSWAAGLDGIVIEDGVDRYSGFDVAWLAWSSHVAVAPSLVGVRRGSGDKVADHLVLADRFTRRLYVAEAEQVRRFLAASADLVAWRKAWDALSQQDRERIEREAWERAVEKARAGAGTGGMGGILLAATLKRLTEWLESRRVRCPSCSQTGFASEFGLLKPACPSCEEPVMGAALLYRLGELRARGAGPPSEPDFPAPPPGC